jgi:hypothetical protein
VLWACPRRFEERAWSAPELRCGACGARYRPTAESFFAAERGRAYTLAALGRRLLGRAVAVDEITCPAGGDRAPTSRIEIKPLDQLGAGTLRLTPSGLEFGAVRIPMDQVHSVSAEGTDSLQIVTEEAMWQFRLADASIFRLREIVAAWQQAARDQQSPAEAPAPRARPESTIEPMAQTPLHHP